jgi:3-keto steroid reductase
MTTTVLVTGANSGLGFAICCRLIDEFLDTKKSQLHLLFSTRDQRKSDQTLKRLQEHCYNDRRVKLTGVLVDLTQLVTVKKLAQQLLDQRQRLDAVVWNAGIGGWTGINWAKAIFTVLTGIKQATTYPTYQISDVGALAPQRGADGAPELGQVFTANVFGHYMLTHWLAPLLEQRSRIVWVSSISALPQFFSLEDFQCLRATDAYESSKRLTDLLVLTSELPSTTPYIRAFLPSHTTTTDSPRPRMYLTHPGIVATSISDIPWIMRIGMLAIFYIARFLGSPWHTISPYKAAVSACFCVLATDAQLAERESRDGKGKWASVTDARGDESVKRTEVQGWGYSGEVGVVPSGSVSAGKWLGLKATGKEEREAFEMMGREVWREMEGMRVEWEGTLKV